MADTTPTQPQPAVAAEDLTPDVQSVRRLVRRTGCSIREAEITLGGKLRAQQQALGRAGAVDRDRVKAVDLEAALGQLKAQKIEHTEPCPFGAPKKGPAPTWGDVVARLVLAGQAGDVATIIARAKARGAA